MDPSFPNLVDSFRSLYDSGVVISPLLAGVDASDRFDPGVFETLDLEAGELATTRWTEKELISTFGALPIPEKFPKKALYETAAATAVFLAHAQTGCMLVNEEIALEAFERVKNFVEKHGLGTLLLLYRAVTAYDNINALAYYGKIPERKFLVGSWHRPWIDYTLSDELLMGILTGYYQVVLEEGKRFVALTEQGHRAFHELGDVLETAGYFKNRVSLLHISQFNLYEDYEKLAEEIWPRGMAERRRFLDWAGIKPEMKVLELGCGSGTLTFDAGLAERVGPEGRVVAIDPSSGMLTRARAKLRDKEYPWVELVQARAEELPFEDGTFDAAIGIVFLHFTDPKAAVREMRRVVRPGGVVASCHPLKYDYDVAFFQEWFQPIFELAAKRREIPKSFLLRPEEAPDAFEDAGLTHIEVENFGFPTVFHDPEKVIRHFIDGIGLFQEELADLPWRAREDLLEVLRENGDQICRKYPVDDRIIHVPDQSVKGSVAEQS